MEGVSLEHYPDDLVDAICDEENAESLINVFHSLSSDNSKQDAAATTANTKLLLDTFPDEKIILKILSTLWEDMDGCSESYRFISVLYLLSAVAYAYDIIIGRSVGAPGSVKMLWTVSTPLEFFF